MVNPAFELRRDVGDGDESINDDGFDEGGVARLGDRIGLVIEGGEVTEMVGDFMTLFPVLLGPPLLDSVAIADHNEGGSDEEETCFDKTFSVSMISRNETFPEVLDAAILLLTPSPLLPTPLDNNEGPRPHDLGGDCKGGGSSVNETERGAPPTDIRGEYSDDLPHPSRLRFRERF
jgi:hypothetical protein